MTRRLQEVSGESEDTGKGSAGHGDLAGTGGGDLGCLGGGGSIGGGGANSSLGGVDWGSGVGSGVHWGGGGVAIERISQKLLGTVLETV